MRQQQQQQLSGEPLAAAVRFPEEHGIVLDKWIYDVCGDEDMQFPSHRRAQLPAFMEHCRIVKQQKSFVAGTFAYPSRSGTREVLVLQQMLDALGAREKLSLRDTQRIEANIQQVRAVLSEKTMGASDLPASTMAAARGSGSTSTDTGAAALTPDDPPEVQEGYARLGDAAPPVTGPASDFSEAAREARRAKYDRKRSIAERYRLELQRQTADMSTKLAAMRERHAKLLDERLQLEKECEALRMTEEIVVGRHEETAAQLAEESQALERERATMAAPLVGGEHEGGSALPLDVPLSPAREPSVALSAEDTARQAALEQLRAELSAAGTQLADVKRELLNGEQVHAGRFRQARQRLKDWQDMLAGLRRTHHQLQGQVEVVGTVVQDTAGRLAAASAAADRGGYLEHFYRLNSLLVERTSESLRAYVGGSEAAVGSPTAACTVEVRPLARPGPTPMRGDATGSASTSTMESPFATPQRHTDASVAASRAGSVSTMGSFAITSSSDGGGARVRRRRSRYDVVRHLQRWELALQSERAQLLEAAGLSVSERTTGENAPVEEGSAGSADAKAAHARQRFLRLQKLLLQTHS